MAADFKREIIDTLPPQCKERSHSLGLELLRIVVRGVASSPVIEVILDGPRDVTLSDCEQVSRALIEFLETSKPVKGNYRLDVLSPGLDEPIHHEYQLRRTANRLVEVHYDDGGEGHSIHGYLRGFSDDAVEIEPLIPGKKAK